jgi:hypothetical protein
MAIPFSDIESDARRDVDMPSSAKVSSPDVKRFIRDGYHEILHGMPELKCQMDSTTGIVTYLAENLDKNVDVIPDPMDGYVPHLTNYVKWRILTYSRMDTAQATRAKVELDAFNDIFRVSDIAR